MKFINPKVEIIEQAPGVTGMYQHIEKLGRLSYKSEAHIEEGSAEKFILMLIKRGHTACLEQGTVYLHQGFKDASRRVSGEMYQHYLHNPYSVVNVVEDGPATDYYITTNYRVLIENNWIEDLAFMVNPCEHHEKRVSFHIICDRGVSHELVRHRVFSFIQESTRYCNYAKDKFGNQISCIIPSWATNEFHEGDTFDANDIAADKVVMSLLNKKYTGKGMLLITGCVSGEATYLEMVKTTTPQEARAVLPNATKTELGMTGTVEQWKDFLRLRSPKYDAKGMHPDMAVIGDLIYDALVNQEFIEALVQ